MLKFSFSVFLQVEYIYCYTFMLVLLEILTATRPNLIPVNQMVDDSWEKRDRPVVEPVRSKGEHTQSDQSLLQEAARAKDSFPDVTANREILIITDEQIVKNRMKSKSDMKSALGVKTRAKDSVFGSDSVQSISYHIKNDAERDAQGVENEAFENSLEEVQSDDVHDTYL